MSVDKENPLKMFELRNGEIRGLSSGVALTTVNAKAHVGLCQRKIVLSVENFLTTVKM